MSKNYCSFNHYGNSAPLPPALESVEICSYWEFWAAI